MWPSEEWASRLYNIANSGLIFSLIVGVLCTALIVWMGNVKEAYLNVNLASTKEHVVNAEKSASDALTKQQEVEIELSKQKERAAVAEKSLLELQNQLADRSLNDAQFKEIAAHLTPFAGQEYEITAYWDSKESVGIAERINEALQSAGWKFLPMTTWRGLMGGVVGVQVWFHPEADESTKKAARSLIAILLKAGLHTEERAQNPKNNPKHNKINLSVGAKR